MSRVRCQVYLYRRKINLTPYLLRAFTINAVYLIFDEDKKGWIEVEKLADFVVLSADYLTVLADSIYDIKGLITVVGGKTVYEVTNRGEH